MVLSKASLFLFVEYICETFDCSSFFQSRWWFPGWEPTFQEYSAEAWPWTGQMGPRQRWLPMLKMAKNREYFCQKVRQFLHLKVTIGTHNGSFHCDESLACSLLKLLPQYANARVVRTRWRSSFECKIYSPIIILNLKQFIIFLPFRDPAVLDTCTLVVDVGGEFNREKHRYDHHQKTFSETLNSLDSKKKWVTKLSSAGLVYCFFGREVIATVLGVKPDNKLVEKVFDKVYENFIEEIDAIDNGILTHDGEPRYSISTNLSSRVAHLAPTWQDPNPDFDSAFVKAMDLTKTEFLDRVNYYGKVWWGARDIVNSALQARCREKLINKLLVRFWFDTGVNKSHL